mmetsp:Transcript_5798/g.20992  ORF Transcript_5798/g.20992 Transcript_5798/m.20992 type:complete len:252 (+) Transcript_5798:1518-2273(+)
MSTRMEPEHGSSALKVISLKENFVSSAPKFAELVSACCEPYVSTHRTPSFSTDCTPLMERATTVTAHVAGVTRTVALEDTVPSTSSPTSPKPMASAAEPIHAEMFNKPTPRAAFFDTGFERMPVELVVNLTCGTLMFTTYGVLRTYARPSSSRGRAASGSIASPMASSLASVTKIDTCSPSNSLSAVVENAKVCPTFAQIPPKPVGVGENDCTTFVTPPSMTFVTGVPTMLAASPSTETSIICTNTYDSGS